MPETLRDLLTIVIPTRNEEKNLPKCLACIGDFAQVLVVDSSSTDRTPEIAMEHGARCVNFVWNRHFPKKLNWVIEQGLVETEWILFLDADEFLTETFKEELTRRLPSTDCHGFWLSFENRFMGKPLRFGIPFRKLFMVRRGRGQFQRVEDEGWTDVDIELHQHIEVDGRVGYLKARIVHENYNGLEHFIAKHNAYSTWEAKRYLAGQTTGGVSFRQKVKRRLINSYFLGPAYFVVNYVFRLGFLDGMRGLVYSVMKGTYFLEVKLKIDELRSSIHGGEGRTKDLG